jgi:hypothetical protein
MVPRLQLVSAQVPTDIGAHKVSCGNSLTDKDLTYRPAVAFVPSVHVVSLAYAGASPFIA